MRTPGFPEILSILVLFGVYGLLFFVVWKFYQVLSRMNDNLTGIRRALERRDSSPGPAE